MPRQRIETTERHTRPERVPLHEQRNKLTAQNLDERFEHRWVNDVEDRISSFKIAGWEVAPKTKVGDTVVDDGNSTTTTFNEKSVGQRTKAILMRIPKELYLQDQQAKQEAVDASEAAMRSEAISQFSGNRNPQLQVSRKK